MKKRFLAIVLCLTMAVALLAGCGGNSAPAATSEAPAESAKTEQAPAKPAE